MKIFLGFLVSSPLLEMLPGGFSEELQEFTYALEQNTYTTMHLP